MNAFLAISLALAASPAPSAPGPEGPALFTLDRTKEGCAAVLRSLPSGSARTLWTAKECADHVLLDVEKKRAVVVKAGGVRARGFDGSVKELGAVPGDVVDVWLEASGALRATTLELEPKGLEMPDDDSLPPWGTPALAVLWELDASIASGVKPAKPMKPTWKRLEAKPTKAEAGDTPGVGVLTAKRTPKPSVVSVRDLAARMTCVGGAHACDVEGAASKKLVGAGGDDMAGTLAVEDARMLVFRVSVGDTPHAFPPVLACPKSGACAKPVVLEKRDASDPMGGRQLGIAAAGSFVLLAEEYTGNAPRVLDVTTGKELFALPSSTSAVLLTAEQAKGLAR